MRLNEVVKGLQELARSPVCFSRFAGGGPHIRVIRPMSGHDANPEITDLCHDSREIVSGRPGVLFACVKGEHFDGHEFAKKAFDLGCVAFLCEHELSIEASQIVVPDVRAIMGFVSAFLNGNPSEKMTMIGLTGTNGKTTTSYITRSILRETKATVGMLGTVVYDDGTTEIDATRTTPEGPDVQAMLSKMVKNGAKFCVMEASSHGLDQGRLNGCRFDRVGFGNLTLEHMEYHEDMARYFAAKRLLFRDYVNEDWWGSINVDDEYGVELFSDFSERSFGFTCGRQPDMDPRRLYKADNVSISIDGTAMEIVFPDGECRKFLSPLIGYHNVYNIMESVSLADLLEIDRETIQAGVAHCPQIPGRLERYRFDNGITVFVDFAHSPDGMEKVLQTISPLCEGRVWVAWGAGGDRSPVKRPVVGALMAQYADCVVITTDNPRSERPSDIAKDVEAGLLASGYGVRHEVLLDRREAIFFCLDGAESGDVVLLAGKGPERYIEFENDKVPFRDADVVAEWARERSRSVLR